MSRTGQQSIGGVTVIPKGGALKRPSLFTLRSPCLRLRPRGARDPIDEAVLDCVTVALRSLSPREDPRRAIGVQSGQRPLSTHRDVLLGLRPMPASGGPLRFPGDVGRQVSSPILPSTLLKVFGWIARVPAAKAYDSVN
jgi:hypothetical protein